MVRNFFISIAVFEMNLLGSEFIIASICPTPVSLKKAKMCFRIEIKKICFFQKISQLIIHILKRILEKNIAYFIIF